MTTIEIITPVESHRPKESLNSIQKKNYEKIEKKSKRLHVRLKNRLLGKMENFIFQKRSVRSEKGNVKRRDEI